MTWRARPLWPRPPPSCPPGRRCRALGDGGTRHCVQAKRASDSGGVEVNTATNGQLRMTLRAPNPLVPLAPDIHAVAVITVATDGTLTISYKTTSGPSIAIQVIRSAGSNE